MKDYVYSSSRDQWEWIELPDQKPDNKKKKKPAQNKSKGISKAERILFLFVIGVLLIGWGFTILYKSYQNI